VIAAVVSLAAVFLAYRRFIQELPERIRRRLIVAAGLYVAGEVGIEMVSAWYVETHNGSDLAFATITSVEEVFGLVGVILALSALLEFARTSLVNLRSALPETSPGDSVHGQPLEPASAVAREGSEEVRHVQFDRSVTAPPA
jgi:hypothetical protein